MNGIFGKSGINDMAYGLKVLDKKNSVIAGNIANADTPNYKAKKLVFEEAMHAYLGQGGTKSSFTLTKGDDFEPLGMSTGVDYNYIRFQNNPSMRTDFNDVNLDYEMTEQATTSIMYNMLTNVTGNKFMKLKEIIRTR